MFNMLQARLLVINNTEGNKISNNIVLVFDVAVAYFVSRELATVMRHSPHNAIRSTSYR